MAERASTGPINESGSVTPRVYLATMLPGQGMAPPAEALGDDDNAQMLRCAAKLDRAQVLLASIAARVDGRLSTTDGRLDEVAAKLASCEIAVRSLMVPNTLPRPNHNPFFHGPNSTGPGCPWSART